MTSAPICISSFKALRYSPSLGREVTLHFVKKKLHIFLPNQEKSEVTGSIISFSICDLNFEEMYWVFSVSCFGVFCKAEVFQCDAYDFLMH